MIYFSKGLVKFPRHFNESATNLTIVNELTGDEITIPVLSVSSNSHYYEFDLSDVELKNGTYKYHLGSEVGLLQVGEYVATHTEYKERKTNVVYNG